jgi:FkbM family methyltransferase
MRELIGKVLQPLLKNQVYTVRRGLAKGLKRKGGLGFIPFARLTPEQDFLLTLDLSGQTIYDVGGYQGVFTLFFARACGASGKVFTFEPNPKSYETILANVRLNALGNVDVRKVALGSSTTDGVLAVEDANMGTASLQTDIKEQILQRKGTSAIPVAIDTMDHQVASHGLPGPSFVKIDVEGLEMDVLIGMKDTLERFKPQLFIEIHGADIPKKIANVTNVVNFLLDRSYSIRHVESGETVRYDNAAIAKVGHLYCRYDANAASK